MGVSYVGLKAKDMGFDAHLTVVYFGPNADKRKITEIHKIISDPIYSGKLWVKRTGIELFGVNRTIPVLLVDVPDELLKLREILEPFSSSQYKDWNPHITLRIKSQTEIRIPYFIELTDLGVY